MTADASAPPPRPEYVEVSEFGPAKEWRWKWRFRGSSILLYLTLLIILSILFYGPALWLGEVRGSKAIFYGLALLVCTVALGYYYLASILNTTTVRHAPGVLEIVHHPYARFFGGGRWETRAFTAIRFETVHGSKGSVSYRIMATRSDGKPMKLLSDPGERDLLRFLAHDLAATMQLPFEASG